MTAIPEGALTAGVLVLVVLIFYAVLIAWVPLAVLSGSVVALFFVLFVIFSYTTVPGHLH